MSMPQTEVSYAPTKAFQQAFPDEVQAQAAKFTQPTWASAPGMAAFTSSTTVPTPLTEPPERPAAIQLEKTDHATFIAGALIGAATLFILYYGVKNFVLPLVFGNGQVE